MIPDYQATLDFLTAFSPPPWTLVAIEPATTGPTRAPGEVFEDLDAILPWLERHTDWNLYFAVAETTPVRTTPEKTELTALRCLHVDLDLPKGVLPTQPAFTLMLARLHTVTPPPTAIIFSGGGYQAFWLFPAPLPPSEIPKIEATNETIARALGADRCHNANRLMRLPGTINRLSRTKIARGREPALAYLVEADWAQRWSYADPAPAPHTLDDTPTVPPDAPGLGSYALDDLPTTLARVIETGASSRWGGDRSKMVWFVCCELIRRSWPDEAIIPLLLDHRLLFSAHVLEQSDPPGYARRQIAEARARVTTDWERTPRGTILNKSQSNIRRALLDLGARFTHDTFALRSYVNGFGPQRIYDDDTEGELLLSIDSRFGFLPDTLLFRIVARALCRQGDFHPVVDYLRSLTWDGTARIDTWLTDYAQAEDSPYVRAVSRLFLVGAVRRVRQPGCKFDEMLIFINPKQGTDKSTALQTLATRMEWFTDSLPLNASGKQIIERLSGKWIVEASDLSGMHKSDRDELKDFLSRRFDRDRLSYDRYSTEMPRQSVFAGTTNNETPLKDDQNRRFWPVHVKQFDIPSLAQDVHQLWAEAAAAEAQGESIRLDKSLWETAAVYQEEARATEPWAEVLSEAIGDLDGKISNVDAWKVIDKPAAQRHQGDNVRLGDAMRELNFTRNRQRFDGSPTRVCYTRGPPPYSTIYVFRDPVTRILSVGHSPPTTDFALP